MLGELVPYPPASPGSLDPNRPPWAVPYTPLDVAKVALIANSDSAWSLAVTQYYADAKAIPRANILSLPLGATLIPTFADWPTLKAAVITPLADFCSAIDAKAVLLGGDCPVQFYLTSSAPAGAASFIALVASVHVLTFFPDLIITDYGADRQQWASFGAQSYFPYISYKLATFAPAAPVTEPPSVLSGSIAWAGAPAPPVYGIAAQSRYASAWYQTPGRKPYALMTGRIGFNNWGGRPCNETEALVRAIIDQAAALSARTAAQCRALPILVDINRILGDVGICNEMAGLAAWLKRWGFPKVRYLLRDSPDAEYLALLDPADAVPYTAADVLAGSVAPDPYYLRFGSAANDEMWTPAAMAAWPPLPGACSFVSPSNGSRYALGWIADTAGAYRGGIGGACSGTHPTNLEASELVAVALALAQGQTITEAMYYSQSDSFGFMAVGDPLFRPLGPQ